MTDQVVRIWLSGGWVMVPLFALAVLLYTQAFQLMLYLRRIDLNHGDPMQWWSWVADPSTAEGQVRRIIDYTQKDVYTAKQIRRRFDEVRSAMLAMVDRRAKFVGTLVAAAPLLGLLGTVLGMLQTFLGISTSGGGETAGAVASGISEALVTTQTGLTIALPGLFVVMLIRRKRHQLEAQIARLESLTFTHFKFE